MSDRSKMYTTISTIGPRSRSAVTQDTSGFMRLPVELRIMIYRLLLAFRDKICFERPKCPGGRPPRHGPSYKRGYPIYYELIDNPKPMHYSPSLLGVNRTIYHEALPILYGENRFVFAMSEFAAFFVRMGHRRKLIRNVAIFRGAPINALIRDFTFLGLADMSQLRSLTWYSDSIDVSVNLAADHLLACMQAVQKRINESSQKGESQKAVDIFRYAQLTGASISWQSTAKQTPVPPATNGDMLASYEVEVKAKLQKMLEERKGKPAIVKNPFSRRAQRHTDWKLELDHF